MWETKRSLQRELDNSEERVAFHWRRANNAEGLLKIIKKVIEEEKNNRTPAVHIIDRIEKILVNNDQITN